MTDETRKQIRRTTRSDPNLPKVEVCDAHEVIARRTKDGAALYCPACGTRISRAYVEYLDQLRDHDATD